jgi:flavin reductase (DIM6/NTAB) family NADH-FMN oxidoreductase RutF
MSLRKKPWNRVDQPVYSLSSAAHGEMNMNICTYVTPVSMKPKRYLVAIYKNTRTLELIKRNPQFVLQFLEQSHYNLVNLLGKKSGSKINKLSRIKTGIAIYQGFPYLTNALAIVHLTVLEWMDVGDHHLALCEVIAYKNLNEGVSLTLDYLKKKKIISS